MLIREATADDALLISQIIASSWHNAYQELIDPVYLSRLPEEYWMPSMRTWLDSGRMYGCIAESHGKPVGSVIYGEEAGRLGLIDHLGGLSDALDCLHQMMRQEKES